MSPTLAPSDTPSMVSLHFRWSTDLDTAPIARLVDSVFGANPALPGYFYTPVRRLMKERHPWCGPTNVLLAVDPSREKEAGADYVVATLFFLTQEVEVEGCRFKVAQPEIVTSNPEYRKQGVVRRLFEMMHQRCDEEGIFVQRIMGIPHFYRRFGYDYSTPILAHRKMAAKHIPTLEPNATEPYILREATSSDIPDITRIYANLQRRYLLSTHLSPAVLNFLVAESLAPRNLTAATPLEATKATLLFQMLVDARTGETVGIALLWDVRWTEYVQVMVMEVDEERGIGMHAVLPSLMRGVKAIGKTIPRMKTTIPEEIGGIQWTLGEEHPLYDALGTQKLDPVVQSDRWYIRVSDHAALLRTMGPVFERRLASSVACRGWSGVILINLYSRALRVEFCTGKFVAAENVKMNWTSANPKEYEADMCIPELTFVKIAFGDRSLDELMYMFTDVSVKEGMANVIETLFPKRPSNAIPLPM